jgi:DNA polymerase III epsilon subunit-like protein
MIAAAYTSTKVHSFAFGSFFLPLCADTGNETANKQIEKEKYIVLDIETTGLNPWYGDRITCICAKDNKVTGLK